MSSIPDHIFRAYDIRGLVAGEITDALAYRIGRVFPKRGERVILGYDMRETSSALAESIAAGLLDAGAHVIDVGMVSTPTFYFACRDIDCEGGIMVTASHNPSAYNGFKLLRRDGNAIRKIGLGTGMEAVRDAVLAWDDAPPTAERGSRSAVRDALAREVAAAIAAVPLPPDALPLRIVADAGNGMGALYLDALFGALGRPIDRMYFDLDGRFPNHVADPVQIETLRDLQSRVRETNADLGIATDGDGDRIFFVDERGERVPSSLTTAIVATELLRERGGGLVLVDVRAQRNVCAAVAAAGGTTADARVGHAHISEQLRREGGLFAGEFSGHYFFADAGYAESSVRAILSVLRALAASGRSLSELAESFRVVAESGEINFPLGDRAAMDRCVAALGAAHADGRRSDLDGIAVEYPDWRFNVRPSNTEPLLRLNVEGDTPEVVGLHVSEIRGIIEGCTQAQGR